MGQVKLREFFNNGGGGGVEIETEIEIIVLETHMVNWKWGLTIQGFEISLNETQ